MRRRASPLVQAGVFLGALAAFFAATIMNAITRQSLTMEFVPLSALTVTLAAVATIYTRSLWPSIVLATLSLSVGLYALAILSTHNSIGTDIWGRLELASAIRRIAELSLGSLAGWLWCRRDSRLATSSPSA